MTPFPPEWASGFGDDEFGIWADLSYREVTQRLRWIEPGEFWMGSPETESGREDREGPQHRVTLTQGFWLADTACTQAFWLAVVGGKNPSRFTEDVENPVEQVTWYDITEQFLPVLQSLLGDAVKVELPIEAQWEYACRAGTDTAYSFGAQIDSSLANFGRKSIKTVPVTRFPANPWGLMQMHGNVWEWCRDDRRKYADEAVFDPEGPSGSHRALRGGSWLFEARSVRSAFRGAGWPGDREGHFGFRFSLRSLSPVQLMRPKGTKESVKRPKIEQAK
jgi:formylglycine-generating enzyme